MIHTPKEPPVTVRLPGESREWSIHLRNQPVTVRLPWESREGSIHLRNQPVTVRLPGESREWSIHLRNQSVTVRLPVNQVPGGNLTGWSPFVLPSLFIQSKKILNYKMKCSEAQQNSHFILHDYFSSHWRYLIFNYKQIFLLTHFEVTIVLLFHEHELSLSVRSSSTE